MDVLVSDLTDSQVVRRMALIEESLTSVSKELTTGLRTQYQTDVLMRRRRAILLMYSEIVAEAAYRQLLTIH